MAFPTRAAGTVRRMRLVRPSRWLPGLLLLALAAGCTEPDPFAAPVPAPTAGACDRDDRALVVAAVPPVRGADSAPSLDSALRRVGWVFVGADRVPGEVVRWPDGPPAVDPVAMDDLARRSLRAEIGGGRAGRRRRRRVGAGGVRGRAAARRVGGVPRELRVPRRDPAARGIRPRPRTVGGRRLPGCRARAGGCGGEGVRGVRQRREPDVAGAAAGPPRDRVRRRPLAAGRGRARADGGRAGVPAPRGVAVDARRVSARGCRSRGSPSAPASARTGSRSSRRT